MNEQNRKTERQTEKDRKTKRQTGGAGKSEEKTNRNKSISISKYNMEWIPPPPTIAMQ
jgi:hypothetical protein